jgi:hypothetical protein
LRGRTVFNAPKSVSMAAPHRPEVQRQPKLASLGDSARGSNHAASVASFRSATVSKVAMNLHRRPLSPLPFALMMLSLGCQPPPNEEPVVVDNRQLEPLSVDQIKQADEETDRGLRR